LTGEANIITKNPVVKTIPGKR